MSAETLMNKSAEFRAFKLALPELFAHRKGLIVLSATSLLSTVAEISSIALMIPLLGGRFPIDAVAEVLSRFDHIDRVMITGALMVLLLCVRGALGWLNCRWSVQLESEVTRVASIRAMKSFSLLPLDFIHDAGQARLLDIVEGAPDSLGQLVQDIGGLATSFLSLCFIVAAMAIVSGPIVLVVLLTGLVSMYVVFLVTRRIEPLAHKVLELEELQYETSLAYIENQRLLRVSKAELSGLRRLADIAMAIARLNIRYESISSLIDPINVLFGALLITAGLVYAALYPVDLPLVLFFLVMASRLQPRFSELDSTRHEIVTLYPDVKRLFWLQGHALDETSGSFSNESDYEDIRASEDLTTLAKIDPVAAVLEELGGAEFGLAIERENQENQPVSTLTSGSEPSAAVEVRDLKYAYAAQSALFESASLSVKPGEFLAITGVSGIGKSTFLELLLGLRVPDSGCIEIDGVSAQDCDHRFWLRQMAWVPQRVELMPLSLRENLTLGVGEKSDDEVAEALSAASAFDFVEQLPDRLDTRVGRRGRRLSEGQMQRIGIARALLRKPKLLLLDEPTSSLDPESAEQIRSVLESLRGSVTIIAAAHSENIVDIADRSVELKNRNFYLIHKDQP